MDSNHSVRRFDSIRLLTECWALCVDRSRVGITELFGVVFSDVSVLPDIELKERKQSVRSTNNQY